MSYPHVLSEDQTINAALAGRSLSRFGDGELRIALGGQAISQAPNAALAAEFRRLLAEPQQALVTIPRLTADMPYRWFWSKYEGQRFVDLYKQPSYGSTFVSRPDCANGIDRPDYWAKVRSLWFGKDVVFVAGDPKALDLTGAASVRYIAAPKTDAYARIEQLQEEIGRPTGPVLLCLGATATALAARLANKGVYALDLGHIGMFMRSAGAFARPLDDLASPEYREQLRAKHGEHWGTTGHKFANEVRIFYDRLGATSLLDYGCGKGTLAKALAPLKVREYDPAIAGKDDLPKPASMVACTDVLEHIEPERLDAVMAHIYALAGKGAYFVISLRKAGQSLPDGRNAHLLVESSDWWIERIKAQGWTVFEAAEERKELRLCLSK